MTRPAIVTVDDDPAGVGRSGPRPATTLRTRLPAGPGLVRGRGARRAGRARAPRPTRGADRRRPADAADDRHRGARRGPDPWHAAGAKLRAADGVRRHRRRHPGHQRHRPRLLPAEAVGPARGAALPGGRRPARRLAQREPRPHLATCGWSATAGPSAATRSRRSWPATTCRTAGSTSSATRRASGSRGSPGPRPTDLPLVLLPEGDPLRSPTTSSSADALGPAHPGRSSRSTTCASSVADRPGSPPPCTPRREGLAHGRGRARGAGRAGRARAPRSRTTSASPRASAAPTSPSGRWRR